MLNHSLKIPHQFQRVKINLWLSLKFDSVGVELVQIVRVILVRNAEVVLAYVSLFNLGLEQLVNLKKI